MHFRHLYMLAWGLWIPKLLLKRFTDVVIQSKEEEFVGGKMCIGQIPIFWGTDYTITMATKARARRVAGVINMHDLVQARLVIKQTIKV